MIDYPLTRDQQIEFIKTSKQRRERLIERWSNDADICRMLRGMVGCTLTEMDGVGNSDTMDGSQERRKVQG